MPASMREAQAQDWLEDLREFGADIVSVACGEWRRRPGGKRPTPGDIRVLCIEEHRQRRAREQPVYLPAPRHRVSHDSEELRREGHAVANEWAKRRGHADFDAYLAAGGSYAEAIGSMLTATIEVRRVVHPAAVLGVKATEYRPSPESLAAGRRALGLEPEATW